MQVMEYIRIRTCIGRNTRLKMPRPCTRVFGLLLCLFVAIYIIEAYFVHQKAYFVKLFNETSHVIMGGSSNTIGHTNGGQGDDVPQRQPRKKILFYNPATFQLARNIKMSKDILSNCEVNSCEMTFDRKDANRSDALIIHHRNMRSHKPSRPSGQIWIMIQHEASCTYSKRHSTVYQNEFNWTATYSVHSDFYLPYGKIVHKDSRISRDYHAIANNKTKDAVWVVSHCHTRSKRETYVNILRRYISIDVLGACGTKWNCGRRYNHDSGDCFDILNNTYRFYIAFENAICDEYITEKFFENFNYDIIQVVRGGDPKKRPIDIKHDVYISANNFKSADDLGRYLKTLSHDTNLYASKLKVKDEYKAESYMNLFKVAACDICKQLHNPEKYQYVYQDIHKWIQTTEPCFEPSDLA